MHQMLRPSFKVALLAAAVGLASGEIASAAQLQGQAPAPVAAQPGPQQPGTFSSNDLIGAGHKFFGEISNGLASVIEAAVSRYGQPNGYILGQQASGALVVGLTYGEGTLYTRNAGERKVYIQGPSLGADVGGDGARTMILVYNLPSVDALFARYGGVSGSAYFVGGFGMTALQSDKVTIVPVRSGLGARLGVNVQYLKLTPSPTWNPF